MPMFRFAHCITLPKAQRSQARRRCICSWPDYILCILDHFYWGFKRNGSLWCVSHIVTCLLHWVTQPVCQGSFLRGVGETVLGVGEALRLVALGVLAKAKCW